MSTVVFALAMMPLPDVKAFAIFGAEYVLLNPFPQAELSGDILCSSSLWVAYCVSELEDTILGFIFISRGLWRPRF